jgi:hypothetical protein
VNLVNLHPCIEEFQRNFKEAVAQVWELQREKILNVYKNYQVKEGQMFEMFRMDFVIDDDANIFLLEVNMSPNLSSQCKFLLIYENFRQFSWFL